MKAGSS
jgi:hypothetical protein